MLCRFLTSKFGAFLWWLLDQDDVHISWRNKSNDLNFVPKLYNFSQSTYLKYGLLIPSCQFWKKEWKLDSIRWASVDLFLLEICTSSWSRGHHKNIPNLEVKNPQSKWIWTLNWLVFSHMPMNHKIIVPIIMFDLLKFELVHFFLYQTLLFRWIDQTFC